MLWCLLVFYCIMIYTLPSIVSVASISSRAIEFPPVIWYAPIGCDSSGFFNEISTILYGLSSQLPHNQLFLDIGQCTEQFLSTLIPQEASIIHQLQTQYTTHTPLLKGSILIHHKLPDSNFRPEVTRISTNRPKYVIGRMMTESNYLSVQDIEDIKEVDEVWVPSYFHMHVFISHGVPAGKVHVVPEAVNIDFYADKTDDDSSGILPPKKSGVYRFVSTYKHEHRKGWDILLSAFWSIFTSEDEVELVIRSYKPHWVPGPTNLLKVFDSYARRIFNRPMKSLAKVRLIHNELSKSELRTLYRTADAFVLPSRGEGWCLPCIEAMAAGLPVIVTNYSGPTMYMKHNHSYPLEYTLNRDGTAEPSVQHLQQLMSYLHRNPMQGKRIGHKAQKFVKMSYSPEHVANIIIDRITSLTSAISNNEL